MFNIEYNLSNKFYQKYLKNDCLIFNDKSILFGYKLDGLQNGEENENQIIFSKLKKFLNILKVFSNDEGCFYQLISQPNYNLNEKKQERLSLSENLNYITDKNLKELYKNNIEESFDILEKNNYLLNRENYIFIRYYFKNNNNNNIIENIIDFHNKYLNDLKAKPLNIKEILNINRKYYGFDILEELNDIENISLNDFKSLLFPNKPEVNIGYIKTINKDKPTFLKMHYAKQIPEDTSELNGYNLHSFKDDFTITMNFQKIPNNKYLKELKNELENENFKLNFPIFKLFYSNDKNLDKVRIINDKIHKLNKEDYGMTEMNCYITLRNHTMTEERNKDFQTYEGKTSLEWKKIYEIEEQPYTLPFVLNTKWNKNNITKFKISTEDLSKLFPLWAENKGSEKPVTIMAGKQELINLDLKESNNFNFLITGPEKTGKEFLAKKLILDEFNDKNHIIISGFSSDLGSFVKLFNGKTYIIELNGNVVINPFVMPENIFENIEKRYNNYHYMSDFLSYMCDNYEMLNKDLYLNVLRKLFEDEYENLKKNFITADEIYDSLLKCKALGKRELENFYHFSSNGKYGKLFNANTNLNLNYPIVNIEYHQDFKDNLFFHQCVNFHIENLIKTEKNKTIFHLNNNIFNFPIEQLSSMKNSMFYNQIDNYLKTAKIYKSKIGFINQNPLLFKNLLHHFYHIFSTYSNKKDLMRYNDILKLKDKEIESFLPITKQNNYLEFFVIAPYGGKQPWEYFTRELKTRIKYYPTSLETALFSTSIIENELFYYIYELMGYRLNDSITQETIIGSIKIYKNILPNGYKENEKFMKKFEKHKGDWDIKQAVRLTFGEMLSEKYGNVEKALKFI